VETLHADLAFLLRLLVAAVLSGIVGWERETARKRAGLRTHMIVGVSSALFVAVSQAAAFEVHAPESSLRVEPLQMIQAIAVGIGFLGSGVIRASEDAHLGSGLTTAASVWGTAAIGVAAALSHYALAAGATLLLLFILRALEPLEKNV
jgi:putative Mg2+ transporter-C (MgtC) family protein